MSLPTPVSLVLICRSYPPVVGGSEIEAQRVCSALIRRGHRVVVVTAGGGPMPRLSSWCDPYGVVVRIFGHVGSDRRIDLFYTFGVLWTLFFKRREYQIAYFLMPGLHVAFGLPFARILNKKTLMKFSGSSQISALQSSVIGRIESYLIKNLAHRVALLNTDMAQESVNMGFSDRLSWLPNPVDTSLFRPLDRHEQIRLREQLAIPPSAFVVAFVGRLAPEKNLSSLIAAFVQLDNLSGGTSILALVGDGPERIAIENQIKQYNLSSRVVITGLVGSEDVIRWLQVADSFALVSFLEGLPLSLIEAMAVGLPSVVTNIAAITQLIDHEVHGLVVDNHPQSIGQALNRLRTDSDLRHRLSIQARQKAINNFSFDVVVGTYEKLFRDILSEGA